MGVQTGLHAGIHPGVTRQRGRPFEPPERSGTGFNPVTGGLTFYSLESVATYRADPPTCWYRCETRPQWRGSFGGDFEMERLVSAARRTRLDANLGGRWGVRVGPHPGTLAFASFYDRLDPDVVRLSQHVGADSWLLYCLLARVPPLRELAAADPGMAMLIAARRREHRWRFARVAPMARKRRVEVLRACDLPPEKQWLKLLRRIPAEALSRFTVNLVAELAARDPAAIVRLRHLPRVNEGVLAIVLSDEVQFVGDSLLREVGADVGEDHRIRWGCAWTHGMLHDAVAMLRAADRPIPRLRSVAQLRAVHDDAVTWTLERSPSRVQPFAKPPIAEIEAITALRSPLELREEAAHQRNCLAWDFWADACYQGRMYVYRITWPERASVAIKRDQRGRWRVHELKARFNREPKPATVRAVRSWLSPHRRSTASPQAPLSAR